MINPDLPIYKSHNIETQFSVYRIYSKSSLGDYCFFAILGPIILSNFREHHILLQFIYDNRLIIVL